MTKKALRRAKARHALSRPAILSALNTIEELDWDIGSDDPATGPYFLLPGHNLKPWSREAPTRFHRDIARQLGVEALEQLCSRLSPFSVRMTLGGSPWEAPTDEDHYQRMGHLRARLMRRLRDAFRSDGVSGLIALAENRSVDDVIAERIVSAPLAQEDLDRLLADFEAEVFVEGDALADDLADQIVPSAKSLKKAVASIRSLSWEVVLTRAGRWTVRGGRAFNDALKAKEGADERSVAQTLVARAVRYLVPRWTEQINGLKAGSCRFESDRAVHTLICDHIADAVRNDGYGGLGRLIATHR